MKKLFIFFSICLVLAGIFIGLIGYNSTIRYYYNPSEYVDLTYLMDKELTEEDYEVILAQTGLTKKGLELVERSDLYSFQEQFLNPYEVRQTKLNSITVEEINYENDIVAIDTLVPLKAGDIIISLSNHSLGYLHGHAVIMINSHECLYISNIFNRSEVSVKEVMTKFSSFVILRSKELDFESYFKENLAKYTDKPYLLFANKNSEEFKGGICSYLVWYPYHELGVDIDSDKGFFVTPRDILESNELDILQAYGVNYEDLTRLVK